MDVVKLMQRRAEMVEDMKEELFNLQYGLDGAEVEHNGEPAIIMEIDWKERAVLLNYDDVNMEWVEF
jgi:hypothetical protein